MVTTPCGLEGRREYFKPGIYDVLSKMSNTRSIQFGSRFLSESVSCRCTRFQFLCMDKKRFEDTRLDHFHSSRGMDKTERD